MNKALIRAQKLAEAYKAKNPELSEYNKKMQGIFTEEPKTTLKDELIAKYTKMIKADKKKKIGEQE